MRNAEFVLSEKTKADIPGASRHWRGRTAMLAAGLTLAGVLAAGCSGNAEDNPTPSASSTTETFSTTPTAPASMTPTESLSPTPTNTSYPAGSRGCVENGSWTQSQEVVWLSGLVEYGSSTDDFTIASATEKYANSAALCEPVRATAFFWHTENDSPIQLYPGEQQHVSVDGSREVTIENNAPSDAPSWGVPPTAYSCEGSARALYVGWGAIDEGDIPPTVSVTGGSGTLYASHFQQASDRAVDGSLSCYGADPNSNYYWPTPDYSYSYPTPDYSFDWDRLAR